MKSNYETTWEARNTMCNLFSRTANRVAADFGFDYPHGDDVRITAHLNHVRFLPKNAKEMY